MLASTKSVATWSLLTGRLKLPPLELIYRMSMLAAGQAFIYATLAGEVTSLVRLCAGGCFSWLFAMMLLRNVLLAFALNVASFQASKLAGPVATTVCGNVKQALTIGLGMVLLQQPVSWTNGGGAAITIGGAVWFSTVELNNRRARMGD